jgi:hypothetical protein
MPDDCPVNDESRRALRDLARRAEWRGQAGAAGAALDARTLRELGREIDNVLAREPDRSTWGHRASESLAAYCQRAQPDWSADQIAELNRLREDAVIALAPGPGAAAVEAEAKATATTRSAILRRPAAIALAVVGCIGLIALVLALPHFLSNNSAETPAVASTTGFPATQTAASASESASAAVTTESATSTSTSTSSTSASPSTAAPATSGASGTRVTAIQMTPDVLPGNPPEVIVSGTVDTSGTGDVTVDITITGSSGQPQVTEVDESGRNSYNLTQTIYLSQWCGQSSVRLTVSSGTVSQSAPIAISGC